MSLYKTIQDIEAVAMQQPAVNSIIRGDVRKLNERPDWRYAAFAWVQNTHNESAEGDIATYGLSLFYVDRLTADKGNELEVQSVGCDVLRSILRYLSEEVGYEVGEWSLHPFRYRFKDECAGVWADVRIGVPVDFPCGAIYEDLENTGDFNADFNEDFSCWVVTLKDKEILIY